MKCPSWELVCGDHQAPDYVPPLWDMKHSYLAKVNGVSMKQYQKSLSYMKNDDQGLGA